jgi:hypothetical protein
MPRLLVATLSAAAGALMLVGTQTAAQEATVTRTVTSSGAVQETRIFSEQFVGPDGRGNENRVLRIPVGTAQISGTVVASDSGRPIRNVNVTLSGATEVALQAATGAPGPTPGLSASGSVQVRGGLAGPGGGGGSLNRTATTDAQGQFVFDKLPAGRFTLSASKVPYLSTSYGARLPGRPGRPILLAQAQKVSVSVALGRGSVISGTVTGEDNEPLMNARVQVYRYNWNTGVKRLMQFGGVGTDDRGAYRVTGLQPGEYLVAVTPNNSDLAQADRAESERVAFEAALASATAAGRGVPPSVVTVSMPQDQFLGSLGASYVPTFFPGVASPGQASAIPVGVGEERAGVDIRAQPFRTGSIRGSINVPPGYAFGVQVALLSTDPDSPMGAQNQVRANPDGTFILRNVPPGNYIVSAQSTVPAPPPPPPPPPPSVGANGERVMIINPQTQVRVPRGAEIMWARATVTVDGVNPASVSLELRPTRSISGEVVFDMTRMPPPGVSRGSVNLVPVGDSQSVFGSRAEPAPIQADGTFKLEGVVPGRYSLRAGTTKSAIVNGVDVMDFPFEFTGDSDVSGVRITVSDRIGGLTGRISESNGDAAYDYSVVIAPSDPRYWVPGGRRVAITRPGTGGQYTFTNLPAGDYLLAALSDIEPGAQSDPSFLKELSAAAMRITIADGQRQVQDIRVAAPR